MDPAGSQEGSQPVVGVAGVSINPKHLQVSTTPC